MNLPTTIINLALSQGEDKTLQDPITQADGVSPQNVTGWAGIFVIHKYGDPTVVFKQYSFTTVVPPGSTSPFPTALQAVIAAADTTGWQAGQYSHYWMRQDTGQNTVVSEGLFSLCSKGGVR